MRCLAAPRTHRGGKFNFAAGSESFGRRATRRESERERWYRGTEKKREIGQRESDREGRQSGQSLRETEGEPERERDREREIKDCLSYDAMSGLEGPETINTYTVGLYWPNDNETKTFLHNRFWIESGFSLLVLLHHLHVGVKIGFLHQTVYYACRLASTSRLLSKCSVQKGRGVQQIASLSVFLSWKATLFILFLF